SSVAMQENVLFNPTDKDLIIKFNNVEMEIVAGEEVECPEPRMARWVLKKYKYKGLVDLNYTEAQQKVHKDFEAFKRAQTLNGLKEIHKFAQLTLAREQQAVNNSASNGNSALDKLGFKVKAFEKRLEEISEMIADFMQEVKEEAEKPKRGRKKNEPVADQNEGTPQA
ncbi:MAG: hypothetical protein QG556_478, partial [Pseudomonadota bacterium]|nr:hypothetical protein [Pseudomonadota bacterium]